MKHDYISTAHRHASTRLHNLTDALIKNDEEEVGKCEEKLKIAIIRLIQTRYTTSPAMAKVLKDETGAPFCNNCEELPGTYYNPKSLTVPYLCLECVNEPVYEDAGEWHATGDMTQPKT